MKKCPLILADGSHNPQGMRATTESLKHYFPGKKLIFVFGVMKDKELSAMLPLFLPLAKKVYVTSPDLPRALKAEELTEIIKKELRQMAALSSEIDFVTENSVAAAIKKAEQEPEDEIIVAIGSLYLVGEVKRALL